MVFDPRTAKPFDPRTARPVGSGFDPTTAKSFDPATARLVRGVPPQRPANQWESPYSSLAGYIPKGIVRDVATPFAKILDDIYGTGYGVLRGAMQAAKAKNIPDALLGITGGVVSAATVPFAPEVAAFKEAIDKLGLGPTAQKVFTPTSTISSAITRNLGINEAPEAKAMAGTADNIIQSLFLRKAPEAETQLRKYVAERPERIAEKAGGKGEAQWEQAVPPKESLRDYRQTMERAVPFIKQAAEESPLKGVKERDVPQHVIDALENQRDKYFDDVMKQQVARHEGVGAATQGVADWIRNQDTPYMQRLHPELSKAYQAEAVKYDGTMPIEDVVKNISELNAEQKRYHQMSGEEKASYRAKNPMFDLNVQLANHMRDVLFNTLQNLGEQDVPKVRKAYGALTDVIGNIKDIQTKLEKMPPSRAKRILNAMRIWNFLEMRPNGPEVLGGGSIRPEAVIEPPQRGAKTLGRAYQNIGRSDVGGPPQPSYESPIRGALMPPVPKLPAQFSDETGGPMDVRSGLGGSGMAPGLLPERGGPTASTPPPGRAFYEPGQKFVEGATVPTHEAAIRQLPSFQNTEEALRYGSENPAKMDLLRTALRQADADILAARQAKLSFYTQNVLATRRQLINEALGAAKDALYGKEQESPTGNAMRRTITKRRPPAE